MVLAGLVHPVVVEVREQVPTTEGRGLLQLPAGDQLLETIEVDLHFAARLDPHALTGGGHYIRCRLAELALEGGERRPQAGPRALIKHFGPERRRDARPGMKTGVDGEPGKQ